LERGRLAVGRLPGGARAVAPRPDLAADVAALPAVEAGLVRALPQRDAGEQAPEVVPVAEVELAGGPAPEEALVDRLDDALGIDPPQQRGRELPLRRATSRG